MLLPVSAPFLAPRTPPFPAFTVLIAVLRPPKVRPTAAIPVLIAAAAFIPGVPERKAAAISGIFKVI